jgi:RHS repeat-associated protein
MSRSTHKTLSPSFRAKRGISLLFSSALLLFAALPASAQVATGAPPFGSFGGGPDVINLANLNAHWTIPVLHKPGRGLNFTYDLSYDTSVWYPTTVNGMQTWQPVSNWGWSGVTQSATGTLANNAIYNNCQICNQYTCWYQAGQVVITNWVYHDHWGVAHAFSGTAIINTGQCSQYGGPNSTGFASVATDGSGLTLTVTGSSNISTLTSVTVTRADGTIDNGPVNSGSGAGSGTDRNGNEITVDSSGNFYDTISSTTPVLTVSGSGTPTSPMIFTYTAPSTASAAYTMKYTTSSIRTNFGCSNITDYGTNGTTTASLVSEIDLPDGVSKYTFTYEATPGFSGFVTGRLASVTLPTGGTISYAYSGGSSGYINCADGSAATLTRTTPDGVWTYARTQVSGSQWQTIITDPSSAQNQAALQFQGIYETQRNVYQGAATGSPFQTINTCYNASASPCTTTAVTLPITQRTVNATIPGSANLQSQHTDKFDSFGNPTESDDYDFATAAPFPLLRQTLITYAGLGNNLNAFRQTVTIKDGNGSIKFRQDTNYDQYSSFTGANCITGASQHDDGGHGCSFTARANATSTTSYTDPVTPGGAITKNFTYDSLGNLRTAPMNCCQQKSWAYSSTTAYAYPDSVTSGSSSPQLTTSFTYDLPSGLLLTSTDPNSLQTTLTYDILSRVSTAKTGTNPTTNFTYNDYDNHATFTPWTIQVCSPVQSTNTACQKSILDKQGRTVTAQVLDGSSNLYSAVDTQYDVFGRAYKTSNPYTSSPSYWTQVAFDVLGRLTATTPPDNSASSATYTDNTHTLTDPAGIQRKYAMDGLARLTSAYEPDPSSGNTLTLQTSYTYNLLGELTGVTQDSQTRTYVYDALGRLLSATTPEAGGVCFGSVTGSTCNTDGYDSFNNLLKRTDARGVLTSYGYDTLNRLTSVSYNVSGATGVPATSSLGFTYGNDSSCNSAHGAGCIGQLITMTDGVGSENYNYNNLEQMTQLQKVINGTTYTASYAYNLAGELTSLTYPSGRVVQQSVDAVGRLCEVAPSTSGCGSAASPFATGFSYSATGQMTGLKYGNGIYASFGFAAARLQLNCLDYSTTNRAGSCTHDATTKFGLNYAYSFAPSNNGLISGITDTVDNGRTASYTYDALFRLTAAATTGSTNYPAWGISETYDRYGNRSAQSIASGCSGVTCPTNSVSVSATTNRISGSPFAYDSSGNMTNDGVNTLVYDAENHTTTATNGTSAGAYVYDGNGLRVQRCLPTCGGSNPNTVYIFSGSKVIAEYDNGAAVTSPSREYIYASGALITKIDSSGTKYYHHDHLSNRLVTDSSGNTLEQMGHFPYGEQWYNASADKLVFTTYERDSESGNDYAQARYNVSRLGRFSSPDPIAGSTSDPQSLNRYSYVRNMPVRLTDPAGLTPQCNTAKTHETWQDYVSAGGPAAAESDSDLADVDPEPPQQGTGCGQPAPWYYTSGGGGGGVSIDGGETFDPADGAGGILGGSESTVQCPESGCTTARWTTQNGGQTYAWQYVQYSAFAGGGAGYYGVYGPGALYFTANAAGTAAVQYYGPISAQSSPDGTRNEYGGTVYVDQSGIYSYTGALDVGPDCAQNEDCTASIPTWVPGGTTEVADWHTHPWEGNSGNFGGPVAGSEVYFGGVLISGPVWVGDRAGPNPYPTYVSQPIGGSFGVFVVGAGTHTNVCHLSGPPLPGVSPCQ